jgi:hypothetical protein
MRVRAVATTVLVVGAVAGCRSVDLASRHTGPPPVCEVHGVAMAPEWLSVSSGEVVYLPGYLKAVETRFPHHGGTILSGERGFRQLFERRVRDFVCPECTKEYEEYWRALAKRGAPAERP